MLLRSRQSSWQQPVVVTGHGTRQYTTPYPNSPRAACKTFLLPCPPTVDQSFTRQKRLRYECGYSSFVGAVSRIASRCGPISHLKHQPARPCWHSPSSPLVHAGSVCRSSRKKWMKLHPPHPYAVMVRWKGIQEIGLGNQN